MTHTDHTPSNRRNVIILFFTMVVVMLGFGLIIPIMPFYVESFGAGGRELGALMATFSVMQFLFAPLWGQLSDRYGRKPILLIGVLGNAITQLMFGLSSQLWMLFAARTLAGILSSATLPTAMAFIGDSTSERDRGSGMGIMGAAMGVGMVLGPGLGGWLATRSLSLPFFLAAGLSVVALALILLILPESLPPAARAQKHAATRRPSQTRLLWQALSGPNGFLFFLVFLMNFGLTAFEGVFGLYALERYGYGAQQVGTVLMIIGLVSAIAQGALTGPLTWRWGEVNVTKFALFGSAVGFLLMLMPTRFVGILLTSGVFMLFNSLLRPTTASLISKRSTAGQGVAMGLNNSFMSLGRVVGPLWSGLLFDWHLNFPYISGAIIMAVSLAASLMWLNDERRQAVGAEL